MKKLLLGVIHIYRKYISPFKLQCCRFYPSCSEYAGLAIAKHGVILGLVKSIGRIARCHPFCRGGYDPVK